MHAATIYDAGGDDKLMFFFSRALSDPIPKRNEISLNLRNRTVYTPFIRTERYENSFFLILSKNGKS